MITTLTVIIGLTFLAMQITLNATLNEISKIKAQLDPICKEGGVYQKTKPIVLNELSRTIWVKSAPLYHVIRK